MGDMKNGQMLICPLFLNKVVPVLTGRNVPYHETAKE